MEECSVLWEDDANDEELESSNDSDNEDINQDEATHGQSNSSSSLSDGPKVEKTVIKEEESDMMGFEGDAEVDEDAEQEMSDEEAQRLLASMVAKMTNDLMTGIMNDMMHGILSAR